MQPLVAIVIHLSTQRDARPTRFRSQYWSLRCKNTVRHVFGARLRAISVQHLSLVKSSTSTLTIDVSTIFGVSRSFRGQSLLKSSSSTALTTRIFSLLSVEAAHTGLSAITTAIHCGTKRGTGQSWDTTQNAQYENRRCY